METTRKLDMDDVLKLKELQLELLRRGIRVTQKTLLSAMIKATMNKKTEFTNLLIKKQAEKANTETAANNNTSSTLALTK